MTTYEILNQLRAKAKTMTKEELLNAKEKNQAFVNAGGDLETYLNRSQVLNEFLA